MDKLFDDLRKRYKRREQLDNDFADWMSEKGMDDPFTFPDRPSLHSLVTSVGLLYLDFA